MKATLLAKMGKKEKDAYDSVVSTPSSETLPPYTHSWIAESTPPTPGANPHLVETTEKTWMLKTRKSWNSTKSTLGGAFEQHWPKVRRRIPGRKHFFALFLLFCFGILPMIILGLYTPRGSHERSLGNVDVEFGDTPFYNVFADKVQGCGSFGNRPQNSTVHGIDNAFVLDRTFGRYSFSQVKIIDVIWDVLLGRTIQMITWYIGYIVFSDALLRAIERHPASFQIFQRIALEGPSILSLYTLLVELWNAKSKRTKALFMYIFIATTYISCVQMMLGAMTGYDSTSIAFVDLDNQGSIVQADSLQRTTTVYGTWNETFDSPVCLGDNWGWSIRQAWDARLRHCDCQFANGTILKPDPNSAYPYYYAFTYYGYVGWNMPDSAKDFCRYNYPNNTQTFRENRTLLRDSYGKEYSCSKTWPIKLPNRATPIEALDLIFSDGGFCYGNRTYSSSHVYANTRCLPDTINPSYQWGFSTMLSGLFVFIHFGWCVTMYVVWLDAQLNSRLVKSGYAMSPLRAAFAIAALVGDRLGVGAEGLVRADAREVRQEVSGVKGRKGVEVEAELFSREGMRRRGGRENEGDV